MCEGSTRAGEVRDGELTVFFEQAVHSENVCGARRKRARAERQKGVIFVEWHLLPPLCESLESNLPTARRASVSGGMERLKRKGKLERKAQPRAKRKGLSRGFIEAKKRWETNQNASPHD